MGYAITNVRIGARQIGMTGLEECFRTVRELGLTDPERISRELVNNARKSNYIPDSAVPAYAEGLLLAYRRFLGEDVPEEPGPLEIRVYGGD